MKYKIEKINDSQIQIFCEISKEIFTEKYKETLFILSKEIKVPGFRKGNVPQDIIEKKVEIEESLYKTANLIIAESFAKIILENKLEIIGQPEVEVIKIAKDNEFKFKIKNFIIPEITLPNYKEIAKKIKLEDEIFDQKEIDQEIESNLLFLQKSKAERVVKNSQSEIKDWVEISFSSPGINNNKIEKHEFILGEGRFFSGFEDQIIGMKNGEEKSFSLNFPETHSNQTLANKKISFNLKIEGVYTLKLPVLNDDFARNLGKFKDLKDLKEKIKDEIIKEKKEIIKQSKKDRLLKNIIKDAIINIPKEVLKQEKDGLLNELKERINSHFKINLAEYLQRIGKTEQELEKMYYQKAEENLKNFFILNKISKTEKIILSDKEIEIKIEEIQKQINFYNKTPAFSKNSFKQTKENNVEDLRSQAKVILLQEKIFNLLLK